MAPRSSYRDRQVDVEVLKSALAGAISQAIHDGHTEEAVLKATQSELGKLPPRVLADLANSMTPDYGGPVGDAIARALRRGNIRSEPLRKSTDAPIPETSNGLQKGAGGWADQALGAAHDALKERERASGRISKALASEDAEVERLRKNAAKIARDIRNPVN